MAMSETCCTSIVFRSKYATKIREFIMEVYFAERLPKFLRVELAVGDKIKKWFNELPLMITELTSVLWTQCSCLNVKPRCRRGCLGWIDDARVTGGKPFVRMVPFSKAKILAHLIEQSGLFGLWFFVRTTIQAI